jgi:hypothetical protein
MASYLAQEINRLPLKKSQEVEIKLLCPWRYRHAKQDKFVLLV